MRISESMRIEAETKLAEKQMELLQIKVRIKELAAQKAELQTQVDQAIRYLEMAKSLFKADILSSADQPN